jgi:hypothetical protein
MHGLGNPAATKFILNIIIAMSPANAYFLDAYFKSARDKTDVGKGLPYVNSIMHNYL